MSKSLEIYVLATIGDGILAVAPYPVAGVPGSDPFDEIARRSFRQVVSLLEKGEARVLGLGTEAELVRARSMVFTSFPIPDLGLPRSLSDFAQLTATIGEQVKTGTNTLVHCRAGIGRSGLVAAGVLLQTGLGLEQSLHQISTRRGARVPETLEQHEWLQGRFLPYLQQQSAAGAAETG